MCRGTGLCGIRAWRWAVALLVTLCVGCAPPRYVVDAVRLDLMLAPIAFFLGLLRGLAGAG